MTEQQVDILIIGGGLTGATLMLALANAGHRVLLIEAQPFADKTKIDFDARTLALSPASVRILKMLNVWSELADEATAITTIHVSEKQRFGTAKLQADKKNPLGYVVEMQHIHGAMHKRLDAQKIIAPAKLMALDMQTGTATIQDDQGILTLRATLIVAADGADSYVRQLCGLSAQIKDYHQHAVIANIGLTRSHRHWAYERFISSGPMALLPMTGLRASLVWSLPPKEAERMMVMNEAHFLKALQEAFGYRLGRFVRVGRRALYPLRQVIMVQQAFWPVVFVGNAAHTLHPVAGQGFNLGLRDVALLAQCIIQHGLNPEMLRQYQQLRRHDQMAITRFTDSLVELFGCKIPGIGAARSAGLIALDNNRLLKKIFARYTCGFAGFIPDLACGIPLQMPGSPL
ncbi:2-octaprenyl-6-methoxyphenyl hydroxylase [Legionella nagasakiensis]|uniref:2-octaprenyl-6-methoxyphenyl hydroxylase n=1 Tax=Legionella nagasakiensis TaxID=535290 RepID=UPI001054673F|nr:2-octaprenyl-6-methoxyphenyl hydroxylase [Legionella nagasakiensis]